MKNMSFAVWLLTLVIVVSSSLWGQDTTITHVGPGAKHYSLTLPEGPFRIEILEVDLSVSGNKITTALANNQLGAGFEATSSMARRHNKSGRIVIGAINGDYFGIGSPTNPYGFLGNSQILDGEYVFGRTHVRSSFGVRDEKHPVAGVINFAGSVYADGASRTITRFNSERSTDFLVMYNQYFGPHTRTNEYGTEVRLQPISPMVVNDTTLFRVVERVSGVGSMVINEGDYILSGHGTARTFLDSHVQVGDTLRIIVGTAPNLGNITALIGGGPRLITNGTRPESFVGYENFGASHVNDRHPRTAIGFSADSTVVYFVTVDGRQPQSVGMSLAELADFMISFGIYNGVNLDGGGSTTMVIRDEIRNSPAASPERNVANAVLAIAEVDVLDVLGKFSLSPRRVLMDTTQVVQITINAYDVWNYPILVDFHDVEFEIVGVSGTIDNGRFTPSGSGSGYIIGTIGEFRDTVTVTVIPDVVPTWEYSARKGNLPVWLSPSAGTERGIAYGVVDGNNRIYLVSRPTIHILDPVDGMLIGSLMMDGVSGGTLPINDIGVTEDGVIIAANMTNDASFNPFRVYRWLNENEPPQQIIHYTGGNFRLGDKITVRGSYTDGTAVVLAAAANSNRVLRWEMNDGAFGASPTVMVLSDITDVGGSPAVEIRSIHSNRFFVNGNSITPREYTADGQLIGQVPESLLDVRSNSMSFIATDEGEFLIVFQSGTSNENAIILDITNGLAEADVIDRTPSLGTQANLLHSGDVDVRHFMDGAFIVYVLGTNNGLGAYSMNLGSYPVTVGERGYSPYSFTLFQNYPNPFNPRTQIRFELPQQTYAELRVYDMLGRKVETLIADELPAGIHTVQFDATALSSGMYVYRLTTPEYAKSKRMILLK